MKLTINLNDDVRVRLRPPGEALWVKYWTEDGTRPLADWAEWKAGTVRRLQLHTLAHVFGPALFTGADPPIETELELVTGLL